jgi:hypothetical protein
MWTENVLQDAHWTTERFSSIRKGDIIQVRLERQHKFEGGRLIFVVELDVAQAHELGMELVSFADQAGRVEPA